MPFNGSGTFVLVAGNPVVTGTVISSTVQNNTTSDFATGLTNCVTRDGQSAALANLPMGGYKHTGAASGAATGEYLTYGQTSASLSSLTVGTFTTTGNANVNGNVTIGDAAADTLTINPNVVTWSAGSVTQSGNHVYTGTITKTAQPGFSAYRTTAFVVGQSSTPVDVVYGIEEYDNGGCYNAATGTFTAPVAGRYQVNFCICPSYDTLSNPAVGFAAFMVKNGASLSGRATLQSMKTVSGLTAQVGPCLAYSNVLSLTAGDTLKWQAYYTDTASSQCSALPAVFSIELLG